MDRNLIQKKLAALDPELPETELLRAELIQRGVRFRGKEGQRCGVEVFRVIGVPEFRIAPRRIKAIARLSVPAFKNRRVEDADRFLLLPDLRTDPIASGADAFQSAVKGDAPLPDGGLDPDIRKDARIRNGGEKQIAGDAPVAHLERFHRPVAGHIDLRGFFRTDRGNQNCQFGTFSRLQEACQIHRRAGIERSAGFPAVDKHVRTALETRECKNQPFPAPLPGRNQSAAIPGPVDLRFRNPVGLLRMIPDALRGAGKPAVVRNDARNFEVSPAAARRRDLPGIRLPHREKLPETVQADCLPQRVLLPERIVKRPDLFLRAPVRNRCIHPQFAPVFGELQIPELHPAGLPVIASVQLRRNGSFRNGEAELKRSPRLCAGKTMRPISGTGLHPPPLLVEEDQTDLSLPPGFRSLLHIPARGFAGEEKVGRSLRQRKADSDNRKMSAQLEMQAVFIRAIVRIAGRVDLRGIARTGKKTVLPLRPRHKERQKKK